MPDLRNCPQCGRVFTSQGSRLCRKCMEQGDEEFAIVRKYVRDHAGADVIEVSENTGVKEEKILQFLREGRLISKGFVGSLKCERCDAKINAGKFCARCLHELGNEIKNVLPVQEARAKDPGKMPGRDQMHIRPGS